MWRHSDSIESNRSLCESSRMEAREPTIKVKTNKTGSEGPAGALERRASDHLAARTCNSKRGLNELQRTCIHLYALLQHQLGAEHQREGSALWNQAGEKWSSASLLPRGQTSSAVPAGGEQVLVGVFPFGLMWGQACVNDSHGWAVETKTVTCRPHN